MKLIERGSCRGTGRMYNGQFRPTRFSVELRERVAQSEQRIAFLKDRIAEERAALRGSAVGNLARELALEEKALLHLQQSLIREEAAERGETLDTPHWEE